MKKYATEHYIDCIGYTIKQSAIYFDEKAEQFFKELNIGVTLDQFTAIDTISIHPGICQMDLSKLILKGRAYTSRMLKTLEKLNLVEKKITSKDNRLVNELYVTNKGKEILDNNIQKISNTFLEVFKDVSDEECDAINRGLLKMKECISKFTVIPL